MDQFVKNVLYIAIVALLQRYLRLRQALARNPSRCVAEPPKLLDDIPTLHLGTAIIVRDRWILSFATFLGQVTIWKYTCGIYNDPGVCL